MQYSVLLLLTDGCIHDMDATQDLLFDLSLLPCSIIIIGVGYADFENMKILNRPNLQNSRGQPCARDIVQFVAFNEAQRRGELAETEQGVHVKVPIEQC